MAPMVRQKTGVDVTNLLMVEQVVDAYSPDIIINCTGVTKQRSEARDPIRSIEVNSLFPQQLVLMGSACSCKIFHFGTDCVFSGKRGLYREYEPPDIDDLYGRSKRLGEPERNNCLVIRSSFIGHELEGRRGLLEWFMSNRGKRAKGFRRAIFSGLTTLAMAQLVDWLIRDFPQLVGTWHVASTPISKFDLLECINEVYGLGIDLIPDEVFDCDRSLDGTRFAQATGWLAPSWHEMIVSMHDDYQANSFYYS